MLEPIEINVGDLIHNVKSRSLFVVFHVSQNDIIIEPFSFSGKPEIRDLTSTLYWIVSGEIELVKAS